MGLSPAQFLSSGQKASGEQPGEAQLPLFKGKYKVKGELHKLSFFCIIYK